MKLKVDELASGMILGMDVRGLTHYPIIPMDTRLTDEHIDILKAFLIEEVTVRETNKTVKQIYKQTNKLLEEEQMSPILFKIFDEAINEFNKEFINWQSGIALDILKIRSIIHQLISNVEKEEQWFSELPTYWTGEKVYASHSVMMALVSYMIAKQYKYEHGDILQISLAGSLADCGVAKLSPLVLKRLHLTNQTDIEKFKKHTWYSYQMVKDIPTLKPEVKLAIYQHHEHKDGTGYPRQEIGDRIHPYSIILSIADRFVDLMKDKPKRTTLEIIRMIADEPQFDYKDVKPLAESVAQYSIGTKVVLSDGRIAEIKFKNKEFPLHPIAICLENDEIINLNKRKGLFIKTIIKN